MDDKIYFKLRRFQTFDSCSSVHSSFDLSLVATYDKEEEDTLGKVDSMVDMASFYDNQKEGLNQFLG